MTDFNKYPHVFSPIKVGTMTLKNRIVFAPMICCLETPSGEVTSEYIEWIAQQARTGASLITIGGTSIDHETGDDFEGEIDVTTDKNLIGLKRMADEAHYRGAKLSIELVHAGRGAMPKLLKDGVAISSSVFPATGGPDVVGNTHIREMDFNDIEHIINRYADIAERLSKAEFDAIMLHCAHGNLIAQFMSPRFNHRTDWYGGSFENRMRFPLQIMKAIRDRVGRKINIDMRISGDELIEGGLRLEEMIEFVKLAQKYVDSVHVSVGMIIESDYFYYSMPPYYLSRRSRRNTCRRKGRHSCNGKTAYGGAGSFEKCLCRKRRQDPSMSEMLRMCAKCYAAASLCGESGMWTRNAV